MSEDKKNIKKAYSTPAVEVVYAFLTEPSVEHDPDGQFLVKVRIGEDDPNYEKWRSFLEGKLEELLPEEIKDLKPAQKKKLIKRLPFMVEEDPETGDETGFLTVTFKMSHKATRKKDGKEFFFTPSLFDSNGDPITPEELASAKMGAGSIVRVSYTIRKAYCMEGEDADGRKFHKGGLSIDMKAVKVLKVVPYTGASPSASACGFGDDDDDYGDDGFVSTRDRFDENTSDADDEDGDF